MIMKIRYGLLALLLLSCSMANAGNGIKRSEWDFRPEITTGNVVYWLGGLFGSMLLEQKLAGKSLSEDYNPADRPWWYPQIGWRSVFIDSAAFGEYKNSSFDTKGNMFDWTDPGFSVGYAVHFTSKQVPFGFRAKIAYDHQNFKSKPKNENSYTSFSKDMIVPEVALKILFGKYRTSETMYIISLGASYDYAINAKGLYDDKETVNSGFSGIVGLECAFPESHFQAGMHFTIPFYDYFNKDFSPDGGYSHPYRNAKTKMYMLGEVYFRLGF